MNAVVRPRIKKIANCRINIVSAKKQSLKSMSNPGAFIHFWCYRSLIINAHCTMSHSPEFITKVPHKRISGHKLLRRLNRTRSTTELEVTIWPIGVFWHSSWHCWWLSSIEVGHWIEPKSDQHPLVKLTELEVEFKCNRVHTTMHCSALLSILNSTVVSRIINARVRSQWTVRSWIAINITLCHTDSGEKAVFVQI